MPCYIVKPKKAGRKDYDVWRSIGFIGSYEEYLEIKGDVNPNAKMFMCGDFGEHCADCAAPADFLCDYPVGEGKTCDRKMCDENAYEVANEIHYCDAHFKMWNEFRDSDELKKHLNNVAFFKK